MISNFETIEKELFINLVQELVGDHIKISKKYYTEMYEAFLDMPHFYIQENTGIFKEMTWFRFNRTNYFRIEKNKKVYYGMV